MTLKEYRDRLAEEYSYEPGAFKDGFDAAAEHIEKLENAAASILRFSYRRTAESHTVRDDDLLDIKKALESLPWRQK